MKNIAILVAAFTMLSSNVAFAQSRGSGASSSATSASDNKMVEWGVGIGVLAVVATVVGISVAYAASTPSTYGH